ncbi:hypothetical protein ACFJGW_15340 [Burkholderiaceae bacterium UC74_6]
MKATHISTPVAPVAPGSARFRHGASTAAIALLMLVSQAAHAVDGCRVLLCLAAPSWRAIPQCVPPITQLFRDLARGKAFPTCSMSGAGNSASHAWSAAPTYCPPQYTRRFDTDGGPTFTCDYLGAISITVDGALFSRNWWSSDGSTSTEFSPTAKSRFSAWDSRFDDDYAAWLSSQLRTANSTPSD